MTACARWRRLAYFGAALPGLVVGGGCDRGESGRESAVGLQHPPDPPGVEIQGGWLVMSEGVMGDGHVTTAEVARVLIDGRAVLWLDTLVGETAQGQPLWRVVDRLDVPPMPDSVEVVSDCAMPGAVPGQVFALVTPTQVAQPQHTVLHHAWRINLTTLRIEEVPTDSVQCVNAAYGVS